MEWLASGGVFVAGVIFTLLAEHGFTWLWRHVLGPRLHRYRLRRRTSGLVQDGELLLAGEEPVFVAQFDASGFQPQNVHCDRVQPRPLEEARIRAEPFGVRVPPADELTSLIEQEAERIREQPGAWNGATLALTRLAISRTGPGEDAEIQLSFSPSDHATSRAMKQFWLSRDTTAGLDGDLLRDVCPAFSHGFGMNATVETADGKLVLTRRGRATSQHHGRTHISVNEGMRPDDLDPAGAPDPVRTLIRGTFEELGIAPTRDQVTLHSLILDVRRYEWALLGHVDLRGTDLSAAEVRSRRVIGEASDDWETDRLDFVPFEPDTVVSHLAGDDDWVPHGLVNLGLSGIHRFPRRASDIRHALASRNVR